MGPRDSAETERWRSSPYIYLSIYLLSIYYLFIYLFIIYLSIWRSSPYIYLSILWKTNRNLSIYLQGCIYILNVKFIFFAPPLLDLYFFPQVFAAGEKFSGFFVLFCKFLVNWGKNKHTFDQLGENMHFPPFLHSLSINFFPIRGTGGSNRKIYTPVYLSISLFYLFIYLSIV